MFHSAKILSKNELKEENKKKKKGFLDTKKVSIFATAIGEMAEWSNAAVLKTVEGHTSGGSNPSFSAELMFQKKHKTSKTL